jgi:hypothetical protein
MPWEVGAWWLCVGCGCMVGRCVRGGCVVCYVFTSDCYPFSLWLGFLLNKSLATIQACDCALPWALFGLKGLHLRQDRKVSR